ncbi:MAG: flagellar hook-length control protein FliK [Bacillota bacterium]
MKVDQVILEQLDAALNGKNSSGSVEGDGEFAAVLDKALSGQAEGNSKNEIVPKNGKSAASSVNGEDQPVSGQEVPENEKGVIEGTELEEKLELLMLALLQSDQETIEKLTAKPGQQEGKLTEGKLIAALKGEKISSDALKEELAAKIEQTVKQEGGLKMKDEALGKTAEAEAKEIEGRIKGEANLKANKASAENEALFKEKAGKAQNTDKANEAEKGAAFKKASLGEAADKKTDLKGKLAEPEANRSETAGEKPEQAVKGNKEEVKNAKVLAEQSTEKNTEQKAAARADIQQDKGLSTGRSESGRAETDPQRPQNVSPAQEQNIAQQSTIKGDEALQGNRVLNAQNTNLRESVMQQLQGRMTYLRENANNPAEMRVTLHPPELGEVTIRVFSSKGRLSASIIAETPLAREILESSITELRQRMNFVNIQFDQLDVSTAGKEHEGFDRPGDREGSGKAEFGKAEGDEIGSAEREPPPQQVPPGDAGSGVDFWA